MWLPVFTLLGILGIETTKGRVQPLQSLPYELNRAFEIYHKIGDLSKQPGEMVFWSSVQDYLCKFAKRRPAMKRGEYNFMRNKMSEFMSPLLQSRSGSRVKRQSQRIRPRVRKEIRMLSRRERELYFTAVNALKNDTRLSPNIYDVLADFHSGGNIAIAHFGPNFPSWHRLYLWLFENFLRLHVPTVTIPYWASVLDNEMQDPTQSVLWTSAFFGNGVGPPALGPFRHWGAINPDKVFTRNIGSGPLYSYEGVEAIVNKTKNSEILLPTALAESNFELQHGGPHVFIGGSQNRLDDAVRDPIFFCHHAFVDEIWERFRFNQYLNGVNPGLDYPWTENDPGFRPEHRPNGTMGFFPNNELNITYVNSVGYSNVFFQLVQYDPVPICPACGGSPFLNCNSKGRCESRSVAEMRGRNLEPIGPGGRAKRQVTSYTDADTCSKSSLINDYEYKTLWGKVAAPKIHIATTDWVYIPVKLVSKRTDDYKAFNFYSLDGVTESPRNGLKNRFLKHTSQLSYDNCQKHQDIAGKIKIVSQGLNYEGYAEEYVVTDNRLGVSVSYGFVSVKRPDNKGSEVIIAAFDSCGRVCKPYCRTRGPIATSYSGGLRITNALPLQFSNSYAEATLNAWEIASGSSCPTLDYDNIPLSFFCDFTDNWVWSTGRLQPRSGGGVPRKGPTQRRTDRVVSLKTPRRLRGHQSVSSRRGTGRTRWSQIGTSGRRVSSVRERAERPRQPSFRRAGATFRRSPMLHPKRT